jgi:hypothetical protein
MLAQADAVVVQRQEARACVIELSHLARMPESPPAPRDWHGGLPKLCAPSEGLLGDVIVNASEIVQSPEKLHTLKPTQFFVSFAHRARTFRFLYAIGGRSEESHNSFLCVQH